MGVGRESTFGLLRGGKALESFVLGSEREYEYLVCGVDGNEYMKYKQNHIFIAHIPHLSPGFEAKLPISNKPHMSYVTHHKSHINSAKKDSTFSQSL